jgi:hypothetical protein
MKIHRKSPTIVISISACPQQANSQQPTAKVSRRDKGKNHRKKQGKVSSRSTCSKQANSQQPKARVSRRDKRPEAKYPQVKNHRKKQGKVSSRSTCPQQANSQQPTAKSQSVPKGQKARGQLPQEKKSPKAPTRLFPANQLVPSKPTANSQKPECPEGTKAITYLILGLLRFPPARCTFLFPIPADFKTPLLARAFS